MLYKILKKISGILSNAGSAVIIIVAVFTLLNIVLRTVLNSPISGAVEVVQIGMLAANALALGEAGLLDRHIAVPQLVDWLPKRVGSVMRSLTNLVGVVIFGYVTITYFLSVPEMAATGRVTDVLKIPYFVIHLVMAICFMMATIMFVYWTVTHIGRIFRPIEDKPKKGLDQIDARDMIT